MTASNSVMVDAVRPAADASLLTAAIAGDQAAFEVIMDPLIEPGFKLAAVMLGDAAEAQDVVQEACLVAWQKLFQLNSEAHLRAWFLSIVANRCRSMRRARWWSTLRVPNLRADSVETSTDTESELDLDRELLKLRTSERAALFLFFYLDLPLVEVARILKVTPKAAKSRVHRAVTKLRLSMAEVQL